MQVLSRDERAVSKPSAADLKALSSARIQKLFDASKLLANDRCIQWLPIRRSKHDLVVLLAQSQSCDRSSDADPLFRRSALRKGRLRCWSMQVEIDRRPCRPSARQTFFARRAIALNVRLLFFRWHPSKGGKKRSGLLDKSGRQGGLFPQRRSCIEETGPAKRAEAHAVLDGGDSAVKTAGLKKCRGHQSIMARESCCFKCRSPTWASAVCAKVTRIARDLDLHTLQ
ncbi:hypothetical protein BH11PSE13_BH11PSE13_33700 [soil metagenome]